MEKQSDEIYCPECGKPIKKTLRFCPYCRAEIKKEDTAEKQEDEIYCPKCGKPVKRNAVICANCGVSIKEKKSKTSAIILAIFFGFWSWLYTYKKDFKKFWIFLPFVVIGLVLTEAYAFVPSVRLNYGNWVLLYFYLVNGSSWIWAILNSVVRPTSFYINYPKG